MWNKFFYKFFHHCHPQEPSIAATYHCHHHRKLVYGRCPWTSVCTNIQIYSNIFLRILIFIFNLWQFWILFKYFCTNISEHLSLKINRKMELKEFYFHFNLNLNFDNNNDNFMLVCKSLKHRSFYSENFSVLHYKLFENIQIFKQATILTKIDIR